MRPTERTFTRLSIDLSTRSVRRDVLRCEDWEDALGGIARAFKLLETRPVADAYDPGAALVMNLGALSGTHYMTGLRTFFHGWSPLKCSPDGRPSPMWSAGSDKFGVKLRHLGVDEAVFTGRADRPTLVRLVRGDDGPGVLFEDAADLAGLRVNAKVQRLHARFPDAHFAVIGPAGENWERVRYAAIALSTENQLRSGDAKPRFCGRGGFGGVLGSKGVLAIAADCPDPPAAPQPPGLKEINAEVARGKGSSRFREPSAGGGGGTWANMAVLDTVGALPVRNFAPIGVNEAAPLHRASVETTHAVVAESCHRCGIRCHKNVHDRGADGRPGRFRAKFDYEPLDLLAANLGIVGVDDALDLVALVDDVGLDAISCGVTLGYAMEHARRHPGRAIAGLVFGDAAAARRAVEEIAAGRLPALGQGTRRLAASLAEPGYAMECKGVEFPAYLPHTNPGYPFALAGGHMSMRTYLLFLFEKETGVDYWVDAITRRGPAILRDDILGGCKFAGLPDEPVAEAVRAITGLDLSADDLRRVVMRTYLRGWRMERRHGFASEDYALPRDSHLPLAGAPLPHFNTPEFFAEVRDRVVAAFDAMALDEGLA